MEPLTNQTFNKFSAHDRERLRTSVESAKKSRITSETDFVEQKRQEALDTLMQQGLPDPLELAYAKHLGVTSLKSVDVNPPK